MIGMLKRLKAPNKSKSPRYDEIQPNSASRKRRFYCETDTNDLREISRSWRGARRQEKGSRYRIISKERLEPIRTLSTSAANKLCFKLSESVIRDSILEHTQKIDLFLDPQLGLITAINDPTIFEGHGRLVLNKGTEPAQVNCGIPQGIVVGPILLVMLIRLDNEHYLDVV